MEEVKNMQKSEAGSSKSLVKAALAVTFHHPARRG